MIAKNVKTILNNIKNKDKKVRVRLYYKSLLTKFEYAEILSVIRYCDNLFISVSVKDTDIDKSCFELLNDIIDKFYDDENANDSLIQNLDDNKLFFVDDIVEYEDIIEIFATEYTK